MMTLKTPNAEGGSAWRLALLCASCLALAACGGGGGGSTSADTGTPASPAATLLASMEGRWENAAAGWDAKWLLPAAGQSSSPIWVLSRDGTVLTYL